MSNKKSNLRRSCLTFVVMTILCFAASYPASATELVINGSFELPSLPGKYEYVPGGSTVITGWQTILNGVEWCDLITNASPGSTGTPQDGLLAIDLAPLAFTGGGIRQDFTTTPGSIYHVSFYGSTVEGAGRDGAD